MCEWIPELLCLFILCWLHEAVRIESKGVRKQSFIVEDMPGVGKEDCIFREVVTCADCYFREVLGDVLVTTAERSIPS